MTTGKRPVRSDNGSDWPFFFLSLRRLFCRVLGFFVRKWSRNGPTGDSRPAVSPDNPRAQLGRAGEQAAGEFLIKRGYTILAQNVRYPEGELDIVARDGQCLVFVEVRTRRSEKHGEAWEGISRAKRRRVIRAARRFRREARLFSLPCRFDVLTVLWPEGHHEPIIRHFPQAFDAD